MALLCAEIGSSTADDLRTLQGQHIELTTDIATADQLADYVAAFDAAIDQWCQFWQLPDDAVDGWKVQAYVMGDQERFRQQGLIPSTVPEFQFGYAQGNTLWVVSQQSDYYTRHLLLHEGVHSLAFHHFGGAGPTWYMEGTAELLSTHAGTSGEVAVNRVPLSRDAVPYWGRFKLMQQRRNDAAVPSIEAVMRTPASLSGDVDSYGWTWAAAMLLSEYPEYRSHFVAFASAGRDSSSAFTSKFYSQLAP